MGGQKKTVVKETHLHSPEKTHSHSFTKIKTKKLIQTELLQLSCSKKKAMTGQQRVFHLNWILDFNMDKTILLDELQ